MSSLHYGEPRPEDYRKCLYRSTYDNPETINIFTDASKQQLTGKTAYGIIVVYNNEIIFKDVREGNKEDTVNALELRAIGLAISLVPHYLTQAKWVNIFSDSWYSIHAIKKLIHVWHFSDGKMYSGKREAQNWQTVYQIANYIDQILLHGGYFTLNYVPAHENENAPEALRKFVTNNPQFADYDVDINLIRYFCCFNDRIDHEVQSLARNHSPNEYCNPIQMDVQQRTFWRLDPSYDRNERIVVRRGPRKKRRRK